MLVATPSLLACRLQVPSERPIPGGWGETVDSRGVREPCRCASAVRVRPSQRVDIRYAVQARGGGCRSPPYLSIRSRLSLSDAPAAGVEDPCVSVLHRLRSRSSSSFRGPSCAHARASRRMLPPCMWNEDTLRQLQSPMVSRRYQSLSSSRSRTSRCPPTAAVCCGRKCPQLSSWMPHL